MCNFFSCISDGKGNVDYFKPEEIVNIMVQGNSKKYDFNSHTSLCHFRGINGTEEDKWNKWEYSPEDKTIKRDTLNAKDDSEKVKSCLNKFFKEKNILYLKNLFKNNNGNWNEGYYNSGNWNSGYRNSGDWNSGYMNSKNFNSGYYNSGNWNTGNSNSGDCNSGNYNNGNKNSGSWNSGDWNSGYCNSTTPIEILVFNKLCKKVDWEKAKKPDWMFVDLTKWINESKMTDKEKKAYPHYATIGGYLKVYNSLKDAYIESWEMASKEDRELTFKLPNFDEKVFKKVFGFTPKV